MIYFGFAINSINMKNFANVTLVITVIVLTVSNLVSAQNMKLEFPKERTTMDGLSVSLNWDDRIDDRHPSIGVGYLDGLMKYELKLNTDLGAEATVKRYLPFTSDDWLSLFGGITARFDNASVNQFEVFPELGLRWYHMFMNLEVSARYFPTGIEVYDVYPNRVPEKNFSINFSVSFNINEIWYLVKPLKLQPESKW